MPKKKTNETQSETAKKPEDHKENIDLTSYTWSKEIKTDKQKLFVYFYCKPGSKWHNATQAAISAGYPKKTANEKGRQLKNQFRKDIEVLENELIKIDINDTYKKIISEKLQRATFNAKDFYDFQSVFDDEGNKFMRVQIKDPSSLTPEQQICIDGIEFNNRGIPQLKLANRKAEADDIIKIWKEQNGASGADDFDVELTLEGIKSDVKAKIKVVKKNEERKENSGDIDSYTEFEEEL